LTAAENETGPARTSEPASEPAIHPGVRGLRSTLAILLTLGSLGWSAQVPSWFGVALFTEQFLSAMLGVALALVYIHYPVQRNTERTTLPWYDMILAGLGFGAG